MLMRVFGSVVDSVALQADGETAGHNCNLHIRNCLLNQSCCSQDLRTGFLDGRDVEERGNVGRVVCGLGWMPELQICINLTKPILENAG